MKMSPENGNRGHNGIKRLAIAAALVGPAILGACSPKAEAKPAIPEDPLGQVTYWADGASDKYVEIEDLQTAAILAEKAEGEGPAIGATAHRVVETAAKEQAYYWNGGASDGHVDGADRQVADGFDAIADDQKGSIDRLIGDAGARPNGNSKDEFAFWDEEIGYDKAGISGEDLRRNASKYTYDVPDHGDAKQDIEKTETLPGSR